MLKHTIPLATASWTILSVFCSGVLWGQSRYATSDNLSGYVHWIDLYDDSNTRIDPQAEKPRPYSPEKTCGRCHDFNLISHGWHFNVTDADAEHGRPGQPWIWSDPRTGTHLPLSYRGWEGTYNPDVLGLSRWQVAAKLGGFLPGGGPGSQDALSMQVAAATSESPSDTGEEASQVEDRSQITGPLPIDCLLCHRREGSGYSPFVWTEQIEDQNFAYAPTVALGLAEVNGTMARVKELDPAGENLPSLTYDLQRFRPDGKVFIDLVRKPSNNACYYCHTNVAADSVTGERWLHDEDVHLRAGLSCADCHRNSIDHQTVRGFEGEHHPAGTLIASLSCQGCHVGSPASSDDAAIAEAGRLGAPQPAHRGLPPLHFEKLSCTACHSGTAPQAMVGRQLNSIAHNLGDHVKRTGDEYPGIVGPVLLPAASAAPSPEDPAAADEPHAAAEKYTPHRLLWPSFWATRQDGQLKVLNPEVVYELIRRPLKVRREFTEELADVSLSLAQRKELLGEERSRVKPEERTEEEQQKVLAAEAEARQQQVNERIAGALAALEAEFTGTQAVYISGGAGFVRDGDTKIKVLAKADLGAAAEPYAWPIAHNVRPARQSLGVQGCVECHSDGALFFNSEIVPVGLLPDQAVVSMKSYEMQKADMLRLQSWNQMFRGRAFFKVVSLVVLAITCLITLSAAVWNFGSYWRQPRRPSDG